MNYYIIIGSARSGTTFVHKLLASHPEVSALSDEVNADAEFFDKGIKIFTYGNEKPSENKQGFRRIIETLCELNKSKETKACGIKIALHYPDQAEKVVTKLKDYMPHIKVIIVKRKDLVAQYGSFLRAKITGLVHNDFSTKTNIKVKNFCISKYWFKIYLRNHLKMNKIIDQIKETNECLELSYENDIEKYGSGVNARIFDFLGITHVNKVYLQKKVSPAAPEYIVNYETLKKIQASFEQNKDFENKKFRRPLFNYYLLYKILIKRILQL